MAGYVDPTKERFALFKDLPRSGPIHMLNLVWRLAIAYKGLPQRA